MHLPKTGHVDLSIDMTDINVDVLAINASSFLEKTPRSLSLLSVSNLTTHSTPEIPPFTFSTAAVVVVVVLLLLLLLLLLSYVAMSVRPSSS